MVMANNDNMAKYGRQLTEPSWKTTPFKPQDAPSNNDDRRFGLMGQQWNWVATQADKRVLWDEDTFYITCDDTDQVFANDATANKARIELGRKPPAPNDSLIWTGFQFRINDDVVPFGPEGWKYIIIHQIHQNPKIKGVMPGQPPIAVHLHQTEHKLRVLKNTQSKAIADKHVETTLATPSYTVGQWHTYVAKIKFSGGGNDGTMKVWLDGSVVYDSFQDGSWDGELGYDYHTKLGPKIGVYMQKNSASTVRVDFRNPEIQAGHKLLHADYAKYS